MADDTPPVERTMTLTPLTWSKERGFYWTPDGVYYRRIDVDAKIASLEQEIAAVRAEDAALLDALKLMVHSAVPHPVEHKAMYAAWEVAHKAIAKAEGRS